MRWPWQPKAEARSSATDYTSLLSRLAVSQAVGSEQQATATAALEAAAGALSRAFACARVVAPADVRDVLTPDRLGLIGRDLVRVGESLHVIRMTGGRLTLQPASTWYWEGKSPDPESWLCTATMYGPSGSQTYRVPESSVVFLRWGTPTARPYHGYGPAQWAGDAARMTGNTERTLADEAGAASALLLPVPTDGGDGSDDDRNKSLKTDLGNAKGNPVLVETTAGGWGEGRVQAPQADWAQKRVGPMMPPEFVKLAQDSFERMLAACGMSPALYSNADGTAQREALRRWHLNTVLPIAKAMQHELTRKLDAEVKLEFDLYNVDLAGRAQSFQKLVAGGVAVNEALAISGLLMDEAA